MCQLSRPNFILLLTLMRLPWDLRVVTHRTHRACAKKMIRDAEASCVNFAIAWWRGKKISPITQTECNCARPETAQLPQGGYMVGSKGTAYAERAARMLRRRTSEGARRSFQRKEVHRPTLRAITYASEVRAYKCDILRGPSAVVVNTWLNDSRNPKIRTRRSR